MPEKKPKITPKTFYLNEQHELTPKAKPSGGGTYKFNYEKIDWALKQAKIVESINNTKDKYLKSKDPLRENHFFLLTKPEKQVPKLKKGKR